MSFLKRLFGSGKSDSSTTGKSGTNQSGFKAVYMLTSTTKPIDDATSREVENTIIGVMKNDNATFRNLYRMVEENEVPVIRGFALVPDVKAGVVAAATKWLYSELKSAAPKDIGSIYDKTFFEREGNFSDLNFSDLTHDMIQCSVMFYFHKG